jgi:malate dehydrogenase (oxaloacetate-decarboxylating)
MSTATPILLSPVIAPAPPGSAPARLPLPRIPTLFAVDTRIVLRLPQGPAQLGSLANTVAREDAQIASVRTLHVGEDHVVQELVVETHDDAHTKRVLIALQALPGATIEQSVDAVFECHRGGKIGQKSRVRLNTIAELRHVYTPGVARVSMAIAQDPALAWDYTSIGNSVGIFTNGSRVLGLGDIGPLASMPVMEGKAALYEELVGVSATPILIDTSDPWEFIEAVTRVATTFGGIHLEDIRSPDCFLIEAELSRRLRKPVLHDDQHGTATVALASIINACRLAGIELRNARVGQIGLGAAGSAIARLVRRYGVGDVIVTDVSAEAMDRVASEGMRPSSLEALLHDADIVVATTGRQGLITPNMVRRGQVILALSNPASEIDPKVALAAGASYAADGRSINNALAFPGLFKAALRGRCRAIVPEMLIAAAETIAAQARPGDLVPSVLDRSVHFAVEEAVFQAAKAAGLCGTARLSTEYDGGCRSRNSRGPRTNE